jgi:hypothetical protein
LCQGASEYVYGEGSSELCGRERCGLGEFEWSVSFENSDAANFISLSSHSILRTLHLGPNPVLTISNINEIRDTDNDDNGGRRDAITNRSFDSPTTFVDWSNINYHIEQAIWSLFGRDGGYEPVLIGRFGDQHCAGMI